MLFTDVHGFSKVWDICQYPTFLEHLHIYMQGDFYKSRINLGTDKMKYLCNWLIVSMHIYVLHLVKKICCKNIQYKTIYRNHVSLLLHRLELDLWNVMIPYLSNSLFCNAYKGVMRLITVPWFHLSCICLPEHRGLQCCVSMFLEGICFFYT